MKRYIRPSWRFPVIVAVLLFALSGCAYPKEQRTENQVALKEHVLVVQSAVDQFQKSTGVLPIQNSAMNTPIYEKYIIDFKRLKDKHALSQIPTSAFENGGTSIYVLVNVEEKPEVKLMDLGAYQQTNGLQQEVDAYRKAHGGALPAGESAGKSFYRLDFSKLGRPVEQVRSPYSTILLGYLVHESGRVTIDYAPEIARFLTQKGITSPDPSADLRAYLVADSLYVPVKSDPYYWRNNEPLISE